MALKTVPSDQVIFQKGSDVKEIALVIKGSVSMHIGPSSVTIPAGSIIGLEEVAGKKHRFNYMSQGETTYYTYPYNSPSDIIHLINENEKIVPTFTMNLIRNVHNFLELCIDTHDKAQEDYDKVVEDYKNYPALCAKTGTSTKNFGNIKTINNPNFPMEIIEWKADFFSGLTYHVTLMTPVYSIGPETCTGFVMMSVDFLHEMSDDIIKIQDKIEEFKRETLAFRTEINTLTSEASAIESGEGSIAMPSMEDAASQILLYAEYDADASAEFKEALDSYVTSSNRTESSDSLRTIRRKIAAHYYPIYKKVFKKSLKDANLPPIIKMFLNFGFMDERIVKDEDLQAMYGISKAYSYQGGKIIPVYDWLKLIYLQKVPPSLNEFQMDYPTALRDAKQNGEISEEEMETMLTDKEAMLDYEIKNLFTLGNRMTFGRISIFVPIFDSELRMMPLTKSYLSNDVLTTEVNRIRTLDHTIFYRNKLFVMPDNESVQFFLHEEQIPYIILFPVCGQNMVLWQTIEGRKRNSPARMFAPVFFEENLADSVTKVCADYRWEVCKTDQGPRWTDITDPSLTAEYHDFLQFYKKNGNLSAEHKEKIKTTIKKFANNYKKVFINDYLSYIKYESIGNMRLLKQVREIMFKYCTFGAETRATLSSSPQYEKLIEIRMNKLEQKIRPMMNVIQKEKNAGHEPPVELLEEVRFLQG